MWSNADLAEDSQLKWFTHKLTFKLFRQKILIKIIINILVYPQRNQFWGRVSAIILCFKRKKELIYFLLTYYENFFAIKNISSDNEIFNILFLKYQSFVIYI